jgi:hypothetical protein
MSKNKKLDKIKHPCKWVGKPKNGMVEVVIVDNFGDGPNWWRMWVPHTEKDNMLSINSKVVKRMRSDHNIALEHCSAIMSRENPFIELLKH